MLWIGGIIVLVTFYAIVKNYDTKLVLLTSGVSMAIISGNLPAAVDIFVKMMAHSSFIPIICTVMGFAYVMKLTECDQHLVKLLTGGLKKGQALLIPFAVIVTAVVANALPSASGTAAAVGSILIPTLIRGGVHPAIAGSAILAGTWGGALTPGDTNYNLVAKAANVDVMEVVIHASTAVIVGIIVTALALTAVAVLRKEHKGYVAPSAPTTETADFKINYLKAILPLVPLAVLILGSNQVQILPFIQVPQAMLLGSVLGLLIGIKQAAAVCKSFFDGMGNAFSSIIGIIIAAAVFTEGMALIGLTGAMVDVMKHSQYIAKFAASFGPFFIAVLSGSGNAAALAFNNAITPFAPDFGMTILEMGTMASLSSFIGRSLSPVAGAAIICAQLAGVNPMELTKRNAVVLLLTLITVTMIQLYS